MLINFRVIVTCLLAVAVQCSCSKTLPPKPTDKGEVNWKALVDPGQAHYTLNPTQVATDVTPVDRVAIGYPPELIALNLPPKDIHVKVVVDTSGEVAEVRSADPEVLHDAVSAKFFTTVVSAVGQWHYNPLLISDWVQDSEGGMHRVAAKAVPFSMDYVFHFEIVKGIPSVTDGKTQSDRVGQNRVSALAADYMVALDGVARH